MILPREYRLTREIHKARTAKDIGKGVVSRYSAITQSYIPLNHKHGGSPPRVLKSRITLAKVWK